MTGSSPLARGTRRRRHHRLHRPGLIPAHAGNTLPDSIARWWSRAHPHSHREHTKTDTTHPLRPGSSPLARGTRSPAAPLHRNARLIPARAGNTSCSICVEAATTAHPRSRGEHSGAITSPSAMVGSSPLARGTRAAEERQRIRFRLIPARAGNTFHASQNEILSAAHPRSRGEHHRAMVSVSILFGSSPLARGTQPLTCFTDSNRRLIPARAGNTNPELELH